MGGWTQTQTQTPHGIPPSKQEEKTRSLKSWEPEEPVCDPKAALSKMWPDLSKFRSVPARFNFFFSAVTSTMEKCHPELLKKILVKVFL